MLTHLDRQRQLTGGPDLVENILHDVAGGTEAQPLTATRLGEDESVDSDHFTIGVDQWPAAVAGVDGHIGLDVDHGVVPFELPGHGADHSKTDGVVQTHGAAKSKNQLPLMNIVGISKRQVGQIFAVDFQDGQISFLVHTDDLGAL